MDREILVEAALAWKMRHLDPPASIREIAEALACSPSTAHIRLQMAAECEWLQALLSPSARRSRSLGLDSPARVHVAVDRMPVAVDPVIAPTVAKARTRNEQSRDAIDAEAPGSSDGAVVQTPG